MSHHHRKLDRRRALRFRRQVLEAGGYRCAGCGKAGRLEADHKTPIDKGGDPYDPANGQPLCRGCHIEKTRLENTRPNPARDKWAALVQSRLNLA